MLHSGTARRITWIVMVGAALGGSAAAVTGVAASARHRPLDLLGLPSVLLVPVVAAAVAGQAWAISWMRIWQEDRHTRPDPGSGPGLLAFFFGPLDRRLGILLLGLALGGWCLSASSADALARGGPTSASPGCSYRLVNHGDHTCVSKTRYEEVGAAEQTFPAGILLGFFSIHLGAALGGRRLQRPGRA